MPNFFYLKLDTTGPANPAIVIESGSPFTSQQLVNCAISTSDVDTTGYQMRIWGDVDPLADADIKVLEQDSNWITFQVAKQVTLSAGDAAKTLNLRIRDNVHNPSGLASDSITLNTAVPVVTISGPDVDVISKQPTRDVASFGFQVDVPFVEYLVKVVGTVGAAHTTGTQIPTANGSTNMSGLNEATPFAAATPINCGITGQDLETASPGDNVDPGKIIKVFVRDEAGNWSN